MFRYRSGLRNGSTKNLAIGPGAIYKNFDLSKFDVEDESTWGELLGATQGGNKVTIELEYHTSEIDGALGAIDGAEWLIGATAKVESTLLEVTPENIMLQLPGFGIQTHNADYDIISHNGEIAPTTTQNLAIIGEIIGKRIPVIFVLNRARATTPFDLGLGTGKENVTLPITLEARYTEEEPTTVPFFILYPKGGSPVMQPTPSLAGGTYTGTQSVTLAGTSGARIFYTTDGSVPTPATATEYTGTAISISATTTLKVIAVIGADISSIGSYSYIIT